MIAKRLDGPYESGERAMIKVKRLRTADCVVGGFRYESKGRQVGSLLLGLYNDEGKLDHVGFTSTITDQERPALTRRLEALRKPPGFTGKSPGSPSRWSTERSGEWEPVEPELVVEVRFDHVTGDRFRHGAKLMRWRPDKDPRQCSFDQIAPPAADIGDPVRTGQLGKARPAANAKGVTPQARDRCGKATIHAGGAHPLHRAFARSPSPALTLHGGG